MELSPRTVDVTALQQHARKTPEKQHALFELKSKPRADPHPGDGICPTSIQYQNTATRNRELWKALVIDVEQDLADSAMDFQLLDLLRNVPPFPVALTQEFEVLEGHGLMIECASEWQTTTNPTCDQPLKAIQHYQILAIPEPINIQHFDGDV